MLGNIFWDYEDKQLKIDKNSKYLNVLIDTHLPRNVPFFRVHYKMDVYAQIDNEKLLLIKSHLIVHYLISLMIYPSYQ